MDASPPRRNLALIVAAAVALGMAALCALRLKVKPVDATVYVDGYYVGVVDDFDGIGRSGRRGWRLGR